MRPTPATLDLAAITYDNFGQILWPSSSIVSGAQMIDDKQCLSSARIRPNPRWWTLCGPQLEHLFSARENANRENAFTCQRR